MTEQNTEQIRWVLVEQYNKPLLIQIGDSDAFNTYEEREDVFGNPYWEKEDADEYDLQRTIRSLVFSRAIIYDNPPTVAEARAMLASLKIDGRQPCAPGNTAGGGR